MAAIGKNGAAVVPGSWGLGRTYRFDLSGDKSMVLVELVMRWAWLCLLFVACGDAEYVLQREFLGHREEVDFCVVGEPPQEFWGAADAAGVVAVGCRDGAPKLRVSRVSDVCSFGGRRCLRPGAVGRYDATGEHQPGGYVLLYGENTTCELELALELAVWDLIGADAPEWLEKECGEND